MSTSPLVLITAAPTLKDAEAPKLSLHDDGCRSTFRQRITNSTSQCLARQRRQHPSQRREHIRHCCAWTDNLFADVVQYVLTNEVRVSANTSPLTSVDRDSCSRTASFLQRTNRLFFDGAIGDRANARAYLTDVAPFHLCNFMINDGVFAVEPALPYDSSFKIDPFAINISANFQREQHHRWLVPAELPGRE